MVAHADISIITIRTFETEKAAPRKSTLKLIRIAFEEAGVEFVEEDGKGIGVCLRR